MSEAGKRMIEGATEALAVARGEQPAARIHMAGHAYVPETGIAAAVAAERERCARVAELRGRELSETAVGSDIANTIRGDC